MQHAPISRARYVQENQQVRFQEDYDGRSEGRLKQVEAALLLGQCKRSFCRHIERFKADGQAAEPDIRTPCEWGRGRSRCAVLQEQFCGLERGALSQQVQGRAFLGAQLKLAQERASRCVLACRLKF